MKVFVLNLEKSVERKESIIKQLKTTTLDWEIFPAFDGRKLNEDERNLYYNKKKVFKNLRRDMNNGEIGCSVSHRNIYLKMISENIPEAVILEDDVFITQNFENIIQYISNLQLKSSVIKIEDRCENTVTSIWKRYKISDSHVIGKSCAKKVYGAYGYYLDVEAAKNLLKYSDKIVTVSDDWSAFTKLISLYILKPGIVKLNTQYNSDIWSLDTTADFLNSKKKYPRGINFFIRLFRDIDFSSIRKFFP